jgi:hypothetical protein
MNPYAFRILAAVVGLFATGTARADDPAQRLGRYVPGEVRTAAVPAPADDTESIFHRRYYRGYAYRPYYGFSFGYSTYYAPRYYAPPVYYHAPRYYAPPTVYYYSVPSYYYGGYYGIGGTASSGQTVPLDIRTPTTNPGTFRYDGGPSRIVPLPKADDTIQPLAPRPTDDSIKIGFRRGTTEEKPRYKAYGEK